MTNKTPTTPKEEKEAQQHENKQQLLNQLRLFNRLLDRQEKGEKITFDLENPDVRKEAERLLDALHKKLEKKENDEKKSDNENTRGE